MEFKLKLLTLSFFLTLFAAIHTTTAQTAAKDIKADVVLTDADISKLAQNTLVIIEDGKKKVYNWSDMQPVEVKTAIKKYELEDAFVNKTGSDYKAQVVQENGNYQLVVDEKQECAAKAKSCAKESKKCSKDSKKCCSKKKTL